MSSTVHDIFIWLLTGLFAISVFGLFYSWISLGLLKIFQRRDRQLYPQICQTSCPWPKVSVLKPLYGDAPLLQQALDALISQDYPDFEIIFGVQNPEDQAIQRIKALQKDNPSKKIKLVISSEQHGLNRKVSNLINIQKEASSEILIIADADIHVPNYWLKYTVTTLQKPGTGIVTAPYAGISADPSNLWQALARLGINTCFLPGVLTSRYLRRQDCFGATMALTRHKLSEIGGFQSIIDYVADDAKLGNLIRETGDNVALLPTLTTTSVTENSFSKLLTHELRWGRTTKSVQPFAYAASLLQFSLFWSSIAFLLHPVWQLGVFFAFCLFSRWMNVLFIEKTVLPASMQPVHFAQRLRHALFLLLPLFLREWLGVAIILLSFTGRQVKWAGQILSVKPVGKIKRSSSPKNHASFQFSEPAHNSPLSLKAENRVRMACYSFSENFPYSHKKNLFARLANIHF